MVKGAQYTHKITGGQFKVCNTEGKDCFTIKAEEGTFDMDMKVADATGTRLKDDGSKVTISLHLGGREGDSVDGTHFLHSATIDSSDGSSDPRFSGHLDAKASLRLF